MIKVDQFIDIKELKQQGHSIREIAEPTAGDWLCCGRHCSTVGRATSDAGRNAPAFSLITSCKTCRTVARLLARISAASGQKTGRVAVTVDQEGKNFD